MINLSKLNKAMNLIVIGIVISAIFSVVKQQTKLNSYNKDLLYYTSQLNELNEKKEELQETQKNVNSDEYIEKVAREKLDMYYPNETVYIDASK